MKNKSTEKPLNSQRNLIFDTHIHFFDEQFFKQNKRINFLIKSALNKDIGYFCNVGTTLETSKKAVARAKNHPNIFAAIGFHPTYVNKINQAKFKELDELAKNKKVVAFGEIGLDYYHKFTTKDQQKKWFHQQLILAKKHNLPVLLHIREAYKDALEIIKEHKVQGIVHCFSSDWITAQKFIKLGFLISFSGTITFHNNQKLIDVVKKIPLNKMVVETDAPYLAPVPYRGKINLPEYICLTVKKIAELKATSVDEIISKTTENAQKLFNLKSINF